MLFVHFCYLYIVITSVAEVVLQVVHVDHLHISDLTLAQLCSNVFEKFLFCIKNKKYK